METVLYIYLRAYDYFPMIFPRIAFHDSLWGNLFSQLSLASSALVIVFFNLHFIWYIVFSGGYYFTETAFLALGIYKHHWYKTWMTSLGVILFFWIIQKMYQKYNGSFGKIFRYFCLLLGFFSMHTVFFNWTFFVITGIQGFKNILADPNKSWATMDIIYNCFFIFHTLLIAYALKQKWLWKAGIFLFIYLVYFVSQKLNLIYFKAGWFTIFMSFTIIYSYLCIAFLDKNIRQEK
jgi:hypothetical protein